MIEQLTADIRSKLQEAQVPVISIDGRVKRLYSIWLKLKAQKIDLEQVYDFVALRIVTPSVKDCYAALGIIHQTWSPVPGRIKDFIAMPRPNGYQSLHTSVISEHGMPFEVQIRTIEMHRMAEEGIAAHWKYKEGRVGDHRDERYFLWMRQLLEFQQDVRDPQEFIQSLKMDLYPEEVYTFTPKGLVKAFPRGATPVDFAYSIHTDVGHQCVGARVNGKMVPLRTRLKNGDIVEIITSAGHKPSRDWLNFVVTSHARYKIKYLIRLEERAGALDLGRKVLEKELRRYDLNLKSLQEAGTFPKALSEVGAKPSDDLCAQGYGTFRPVLGKLVLAEKLREKPPEGAVTSAVRRVLGGGPERIKVRGGFDDLPRARAAAIHSGRKDHPPLPRQGRVGAFGDPSERRNPMYDSGAPHRRRWDKGDAAASYTVKLTMKGRQEKDAGGRQREDRRHQYEHQERRARTEATIIARDRRHHEISDLKHLESHRRCAASMGCSTSKRASTLTTPERYRVDFEPGVARQARRLDRGARGKRLGEERPVDLVHGREVFEVGEEDGGASHVRKRESRFFEQGADVLEDAAGLRGDVASHEGARRGVDGNLSRNEQELAGAERGGVGADCLGRAGAGD